MSKSHQTSFSQALNQYIIILELVRVDLGATPKSSWDVLLATILSMGLSKIFPTDY